MALVLLGANGEGSIPVTSSQIIKQQQSSSSHQKVHRAASQWADCSIKGSKSRSSNSASFTHILGLLSWPDLC